MWMILDDARRSSQAQSLLFEAPKGLIIAHEVSEVCGALNEVRLALAAGHHVAGYLAYEAGYALDPALEDLTRTNGAPLALFGLFDAPQRVTRREVLARAREAVLTRPEPQISRNDYVEAAAEVSRALHAGDYYQANLTFPNHVRTGGDALSLYALLASGGGGGWGGALVHEEGAIVSTSPEQFFSLDNGQLTAVPMKGTAPRRADAADDAAEIAGLRSDEKQRAENLMIVDLMRNDLARVSETGSVEVPELFAVQTYPTVHQMVSRITSRLRDGLDAVDVLEALFPCGSVTGAPKIAAMRALHALEPYPRGAYTGSMGWIAPPRPDGRSGDAAFNVLIRTIESVTGKPQAVLGLGSGLVVDSRASDEWAESRLKGAFVTSRANQFDLIETMAYDPVEGLGELERHLLRLKESAAALGFTFDRHDARNELQAATFGHREAAMVRLLVSASGAIAIEVKPMQGAPDEPVSVQVKPLPVDKGDVRLHHKTSARRFYEEAREPEVAFETLFIDAEGCLTEGTFTNIFVEKDGMLVTPPLSRGLLPGVLRSKLIDEGKAVEGDVGMDDLDGTFCIGNSARGLMRARLLSGSEREA